MPDKSFSTIETPCGMDTVIRNNILRFATRDAGQFALACFSSSALRAAGNFISTSGAGNRFREVASYPKGYQEDTNHHK